MFHDDTIRLVTSLEAAQKGNIIMNASMKQKQLELNVDKCCVIIFDKRRTPDGRWPELKALYSKYEAM